MTSLDPVDSASSGDPVRHLDTPALETGLAAMPAAPLDVGRVRLLVRRVEGGVRQAPGRARVTRDGGLEGDAWSRDDDRNPDAQVTVMEHGVAELIANGQPLSLFGDQLFVELDLSRANLPTGSRLRIGTATLEVTAKPHNGCQKFRARFGGDALRFVSHGDLRHRNFRGIYLRVIVDGEVAVDDPVEVLERGAS